MSDSNVQFHGGKEVKTQASNCVMNLSSTQKLMELSYM